MSEQDIQTAARALLDANLTGSGDEARQRATIATRALTAERDQLRLALDQAHQSGDDGEDEFDKVQAHARCPHCAGDLPMWECDLLMREARASVALDGETVSLHDTAKSRNDLAPTDTQEQT